MTTPKQTVAHKVESPEKPCVHLIATGGTIAGLSKPQSAGGGSAYVSAQRSGESLLQAMPDLLVRAAWTFEQPYAIGSQNLQPMHMLLLRDSILKALNDPSVDAVVVTHGTDTLEDMLFFQYLTIPAQSLTKPVVFTASMLPSDHPQADGPSNLTAAVDWAFGLLKYGSLDERLAVLLLGAVLNGLFTPAASVRKKSTAGLDVFDVPVSISTGIFVDGSVDHLDADLTSELATHATLALSNYEGLPAQGDYSAFDRECFQRMEVAAVYCIPGSSARNQLQDLLRRLESTSDGEPLGCVLVAAPGHGNVPDDCVPVLKALLQQGVDVVRASRISEGGVIQGGEFHALDSYRATSRPQLDATRPPKSGVFFEAGDLSLPQLAVLHRLKKALDFK